MPNRFIVRHLGIYYMLLACVMFAATGAFAKYLSKDLPSIEIVFFRNLIGFAIIIYSIYKYPFHQKGGHLFLLMFRGFVGTIALFAFFYNIANINLAAAFTFSKTSPIFVALIAAFWFKERLSSKGWFAVFVGFGGILLIIQPNLGISKTDIIGIWSGLGAALAYTSVRELNKSYDTKTIVLSFMAWGTALPLVFMSMAEFMSYEPLDFLISKFVMPNLHNAIFILLVGITGLYFQIFMTKAYAASKKAGTVAVVSYADVIFTIFIGYFMGDGLPNLLAFFGIMLVIISGILVVKEK
ncbi:DMT family transporter [Campylobacter sp. faydin G-24]|uniref:DMT family transporter n=1 Tax=Campylobacter anatolicus TaxID=2829105 RepID=A0ABS5HGR4_9BACT|nr:DMT family transporter [Campylobacter anatolicus]MBR8461726.1 DMT family transporter [Campylobacter anatolicus]MBR8463461.1 DMT family transporter [Campylobacter anatolicus]MBR8465186.1 DMT family transporter [Campylobacter anatolicus]